MKELAPWPETDHATPQAEDPALRALEVFALSAAVEFDRPVAARTWAAAQRAIPGDDATAWARRMVEVGESLNLRLVSADCGLTEALAFVNQGKPVATRVAADGDGGELLVLTEQRGRRIRLASLDATLPDPWVSAAELRRRLGGSKRSARRNWVVGQAALACEHPHSHAEDHAAGHGPSPIGRLLGLIRTDWADIRVIFVFSMVVGILTLAAPIAVEALVNTVAFGRYLQPVVVLAILLLVFLGFAAAIRAMLVYVVEIIQRRLFIRVVEDLAFRLPRVQQTSFDRLHGPELLNRFFEIVTVQKAMSSMLLDGIAIVLQTVVGMLVLAFYHPFLLGFDIVLLMLIAFVIFVLGRGAVRTSLSESRAKYAVAAWLQDLARFPTAVKLHSGAQLALDRADQLASRWLDARRAHFRVVLRQTLFSLGLQAVAATVLLGLGGWLVIRGQLTLGQLVAAELIVMLIVGSFAKLGKHMDSFYDLMASVDKLGHLFDLPIEAHDKLFHLRDRAPARVTVRQVNYQYGPHRALRDVSLEIQPGESLALVGPASSGKSTLVDLLCGVRQPDSGHIELDGMDLRELRPDSLREHIGFARGVEIFHGTIDENVHFNRPGVSALDVREALATVDLLDDVLRLPDGLNTELQTHGAPLSATQSLRLMLARAIVERPRLLLIDGTLDALPDEVVTDVLARVTGPRAPWSLLVVTGRQRVISACQRVVHLSPAPTPQAADLAREN